MTEADESLEHAWKWFELHSKQRFVTMNFFMVMAAAIIAGAAALIKDRQDLACSLLGAALMISAILFYLMDRRARRLVKIAEVALELCESRLAEEIENPGLNLIAISNKAIPGEFSYGSLLTVFYIFFSLVGGALIGLPMATLITGGDIGQASEHRTARVIVDVSYTQSPPPK